MDSADSRPPSVELSSAAEAERDRACLDSALRFLAQRPRSEREIRRRLGEKGHAEAQIDGAIVRLGELGLVDDRAFAQYWIENRDVFSPRGPRALRAELAQKGVPREVVDVELEAGRDEDADAYRAAEKRARALSRLDESAFRQRLGQFLLRRGFTWSAIEPAVDRHWRERADAARSDISIDGDC